MIARIIAWCAKNRLATLLLVGLLTAWGVLSLRNTALDAVPDLSDVQVIVFSEWMGRAPDLVEDNITYPVVSSMLGSPRVTAVRGQSMFGMSFVNVIFEDGTDMYWARSRVLEKLSTISNKLPQGVTPILGPDATGVGWVFEYALIDKTGHVTLQQLQSLQDWNIRYALQAVPGVAEVASVGGFVKEYQVDLDPDRLAALGIPLSKVVDAGRRSYSVRTWAPPSCSAMSVRYASALRSDGASPISTAKARSSAASSSRAPARTPSKSSTR